MREGAGLILQRSKLRLPEAKRFVHRHKANKKRLWLEPRPVETTPEPKCWRGGAGGSHPRRQRGLDSTARSSVCSEGGWGPERPSGQPRETEAQRRKAPAPDHAASDVSAHPAPLRASHLSPEQLGLRRPGALDLVAHAVEQGDAILVLIEVEELRQDLCGFLWKGRAETET